MVIVLAGWLVIGVLTSFIMAYSDYEDGIDITLRDVLHGVLFTLLGPILTFIYLSILASEGKVIIKGKRSDG